MTLAEMLVEAANKPGRPFEWELGEKCGVRICVLEDGQTPRAWIGVICEVVGRSAGTWSKSEHWYKLRRPDGHEDDFREHELKQARYVRKSK